MWATEGGLPKAKLSGLSPSASLTDAREPEADTEWALARQLCIEGSEGASGRLQCYGILELLMNEPHGVRTNRMNDPVS